MENIDIIVLNILVVICFIAFFISTFNAFEHASKLDKNNLDSEGIISRLLRYFESLLKD